MISKHLLLEYNVKMKLMIMTVFFQRENLNTYSLNSFFEFLPNC
jgi:hypothetical protein